MPKAFLAHHKQKRIGSMSDTSDSDAEMTSPPSFYSPCSSPISSDDSQTFGSEEQNRQGNYLDNARFSFSSDPVEFKRSETSAFKKIEKKVRLSEGNINNGSHFEHIRRTGMMNTATLKADDSRRVHFPSRGFTSHNGFHDSVSYLASTSSNSSPADALSQSHLPILGNASPTLDNNPALYLHADPRIPFTNYFNNLVKLLQNAAAKGELGTVRLVNSTGENKNLFNFDWNTDIGKENDCNDNVPMTCSGNMSARCIPHSPDCVNTERNVHPSRDNVSPGTSDFGFARDRNLSISSTSGTTSPPSVGVSPSYGGHFVHSPPYGKTDTRFSFPNMGSVPRETPALSPDETFDMTPSRMLPHPQLMQMQGLGYRRDMAEKSVPAKRYKCDVCGKAFSRSNTLVTHKRIHTGAKPFKCEICGRAFRQPGNLTRHRLTHTTVKPYVCPQCNKAFNRASNLHTHMRTHTNFKPFICTYCGKGFNQKMDLKIHCYTHTGKDRGYPSSRYAGPSIGH